ncbi:MAG: Flp pilus assembly protein CpaB [Thauera sp.]|nr:Flp pilus assembly protein CpaB [Thauera sp.]
MLARPHRTLITLGIAVVFGLSAALFATRYLDDRVADIQRRGEQKSARAVVAKEDLPAGERIDHERVAVREVPADWLHSDAITPDQFDRVAGSTLSFPARRGEPLLWSQLADKRAASLSARLLPGRRAVTLAVDEISSISGLLEPGDTIDLMLNVRRNDRNLTLPLVQGITVLATGKRTANDAGRDAGPDGFATITLDASAADGERIVAARTIGSITALLRAPGDIARQVSRPHDALSMLGLDKPTAEKERRVPVIYGGTGSVLQESGIPSSRDVLSGLIPVAPSAPRQAH